MLTLLQTCLFLGSHPRNPTCKDRHQRFVCLRLCQKITHCGFLQSLRPVMQRRFLKSADCGASTASGPLNTYLLLVSPPRKAMQLQRRKTARPTSLAAAAAEVVRLPDLGHLVDEVTGVLLASATSQTIRRHAPRTTPAPRTCSRPLSRFHRTRGCSGGFSCRTTTAASSSWPS